MWQHHHRTCFYQRPGVYPFRQLQSILLGSFCSCITLRMNVQYLLLHKPHEIIAWLFHKKLDTHTPPLWYWKSLFFQRLQKLWTSTSSGWHLGNSIKNTAMATLSACSSSRVIQKWTGITPTTIKYKTINNNCQLEWWILWRFYLLNLLS